MRAGWTPMFHLTLTASGMTNRGAATESFVSGMLMGRRGAIPIATASTR